MGTSVYRPRFSFLLPGKPDAAIAQLESRVGGAADRFVSRTLGVHVDMTVVPADRHRWSPCLQMEFRERDDGVEGIRVHGLIGPHPNLWTFFAFTNISLAVATCFALVYGASQAMLREWPWGFWVAGAGLVALAGMYGISRLGRRLAQSQSNELMQFVRDTFPDAHGGTLDP